MNEDSTAVSDGTPVRWFITGHGAWVSPITFTVNGIATNRYLVSATAGVDTLLIMAGTSPLATLSSMELLIEPSEYGVIRVMLSGPTQYQFSVGDTINYQAFVMNADSTAYTNGTPVRWLVTGHGHWAQALSYTANGFATNRYVVGQESGTDTLVALAGTSPNLAMGSLSLTLIRHQVRLSLLFRRIPPLMYSTGQDSLEIDGVLRDQNNVGIPNILITFSTDHGFVYASDTTDISGSFRVYLFDGGDTTSSSGSLIYVRCPAYDLVDSCRFWIRPRLDLDHININGPSTHVAYPGDTVSFTATIILTNGNYCYDSTRIYWNCYKAGVLHGGVPQNGIGQFLYPLTRTINGASTNTFYMRTGTGKDSLVVMAFTEGRTDTIRRWWYFDHVPGVAVHLTLSPRNVGLEVNVPVLTPNITAVCTDTAGNMVPNSPINFGCTNNTGTIVRAGVSADGDTTYAILNPGSQAGMFHYWATTVNNATDTAAFTVTAETPQSISLSTDYTALQVRGASGQEQTILHAIVRDGNGNLVANTFVKFKLLNGSAFDLPEHSIDCRPFFASFDVDSSIALTSITGEAMTVLSAGSRAGTVMLSATVMESNYTPTNITANLNSIHISGGIPASISLGLNGENAEQAGGGVWSIGLNAFVRDANGNTIQDGLPVSFSVSPISFAQTGADTSTTHSGVATNRLFYEGRNTFDTVRVVVSCISRDANNNIVTLFDSVSQYCLPLQQGSLQLNITPNSFSFTRTPITPTEIDVATHMVWAVVRDGYGQSIHGCPILFSVQYGRWFRTTSEASNRAYSSTVGVYRASDNSQSFAGTVPPIYWPVNKRKTGNYTVVSQPMTSWTDPNGAGAATLYIGVLGPSFSYPGPAGAPVGEVFTDPTQATAISEVSAIIEGYSQIPRQSLTISYNRQ